MKCTILVSSGTPLSSVLGPYEMLCLANNLAPKEKRVKVEIVTTEKMTFNSSSGFNLDINRTYKSIDQTDYLIVAPIGPIKESVLNFDEEILLWLRAQHNQGAQLISLCTGAFLLAASGLLDNKEATTHWQFELLFKKHFPRVLLQSNQVICQQGRLLTSGGANAYQDILLHIISHHFGEQMKRQCAKLLMLDFSRKSQQMYRTPDAVRQHHDDVVHGLQDWLQGNLDEPFKLARLAKKACLGERQIKRKFVKALGMPPLCYVQYMRVEKAKTYLEETGLSVEDIGIKVSYQDVRFFRELFKRHVGISPSQYRLKFAH